MHSTPAHVKSDSTITSCTRDFDYTNFSLGSLPDAPNKLIRRVFGDRLSYFNADRTGIGAAEELAQPYQFEARAYLELIKSAGRNEPDDRNLDHRSGVRCRHPGGE